MAGSDDFTIFLVIGLMILAIMLAVFNFSPEPSGMATESPFYSFSPVYNSSTAFHIGPQRFDAIKTYSFSFDTSNLRQAEKVDLGNKSFSNGVLFNQDSLSYHISLSNPSALSIYFEVLKSNKLAPLVIKVNDEIVSNQIYEPGKYRLDIDNSLLRDSIKIEIAAASSGWQIWAPNIYELKDISIYAESYEENAFNYHFDIDREVLNRVKYGKVDVALSENVGEFNTVINSRKVYSSRPTSGFSFLIPKEALSENNIISFYGSRDSSFRGTAVITIYYYEEKNAELKTPLNLTKSDYAGLGHMVIKFNVFRVARPGGLRVQIENSNGISYREFASVHSDGTYEFIVDRREIVEGYNILRITSIDGAIFDITDLDVKISSKQLA